MKELLPSVVGAVSSLVAAASSLVGAVEAASGLVAAAVAASSLVAATSTGLLGACKLSRSKLKDKRNTLY